MPFRLIVTSGERTVRHPLPEGDLVLGSSEEADLRLTNFSVSRRHARLRVDSDGVAVEDLGSRNGTRVRGNRIDGITKVAPGAPIHFGTVAATVEFLSPEDAALGISLPPPLHPTGTEPSPPTAGGTTVSPSVLERFALKVLPDVLSEFASASDPLRSIQAVGDGLYHCLPCRWLEIIRRDVDSDSIVYSGRNPAHPSSSIDIPPVTADNDGIRVVVGFTRPGFADVYEPLVRAGASLAAIASRLAAPRASAGPPDRLPPTPPLPKPPTVDPVVRRIYLEAERVASSTVSVLIRGESGTGKEVLARFIHEASPRSSGPMVTLNCAALPRDLLEAELFGVEEGVATGVKPRPGRFELAHGGTLFLDEVGDMAPETQARILRVLQEGQVFRLGGSEARAADVRILAATNRDLETMLTDGTFRTDLYHRIADWVVDLPALRDRKEDIPNLAAFFLARACAERSIAAAGLSRAAVKALTAYSWPGNIRQLEREMGRAALFLDDGDILDTTRLQPAILSSQPDQAPVTSLKGALRQAERQVIVETLGACGGDVAAAARRLGISRSTLYRRLAALDIGEGQRSP